MKKTDKKTEKALRAALTNVCDIALDEVPGFSWITHFVNYSRFPDSLLIVCVFDTEQALSNACDVQQNHYLCSLIKGELNALNINVKDIAKQVSFDSEEACITESGGNWQQRYSSAQ